MKKSDEFRFTPFTGTTLDALDAWVQRQDERIETHFTRLRAHTFGEREDSPLRLEELLCRQVVRETALKIMECAQRS